MGRVAKAIRVVISVRRVRNVRKRLKMANMCIFLLFLLVFALFYCSAIILHNSFEQHASSTAMKIGEINSIMHIIAFRLVQIANRHLVTIKAEKSI